MITTDQFVERLTGSGLMSAQDLEAFRKQFSSQATPQDAQQFAQALVQQGKLTKYQAQMIWQGKTKGLVFGEYVVLDKLGEGGMGVVLKAQHRRMRRMVAIKVLSAAAMKQAGAVERFHREVEAAARLTHPNIVTAFDASEHQGMHYLAMEYVEGQDLASVVRDRGPLGLREAVEYILQAARGLQYAHGKGIVHRDIKPGNLLLDPEGTVKILDMGLARISGAEAALGGGERLTTTGQVLGTCDYMSPEQAMDTHATDHRTDIYALGCSLYRLLTGNPPYRGETLMQILMAHRMNEIPSLRDARPEAPEELDACFQRMVAKEPGDRQSTMAEVVSELEAVLAALSGRPAVAAAERSLPSMSAPLAFLQDITPPTLARKGKTAAEQRTQPQLNAEHDTGKIAPPKPRGAGGNIARQRLLLAGGLAGVLVVSLATMMWVFRSGTLQIEIDEELGKDVQVAVYQGGDKARIADAKSGWTLSLSPGKYDLTVKGGEDQFEIDSKSIVIKRGERVKARVTLKPSLPPLPPPAMAVAPFDAKQARKHQEEWAKYLGVDVETANSIGMKFVLIPPGEFMMGSETGQANEKPVHKVTITKPFYLGQYEVTVGDFEKFVEATKYQTEAERCGSGWGDVGGRFGQAADINWRHPRFTQHDNHPVCAVTWKDIEEFCDWVSRQTGSKVRLPTEAQWEYACRAGTTTQYNTGDTELDLRQSGWFAGNSGLCTHAVGEKMPNAWKLYDMHGNCWEMVADYLADDYYANSPSVDPQGPPPGEKRTVRGGGWGCGLNLCRSAKRELKAGDASIGDTFRVVMEVPTGKKADRRKPKAEESQGSQAAKQPTPPLAVAPFDAAKAKEHQEAWAKHLGVLPEMTNSIGMKFMLIPPGEFMMGSSEDQIGQFLAQVEATPNKDLRDDRSWHVQGIHAEAPRHRVKISRAFYLGRFETTQANYELVMGTNPSKFSSGGAFRGKVAGVATSNFPVENLTCENAQEFCRRLAAMGEESKAGRKYRLPTEAEWEYACRAGTNTQYSLSEGTPDEYGWFYANSANLPHVVGKKKPNAWNLYDMHGNACEWCSDWYSKDYYANSPLVDPLGPASGSMRSIRGGSWYCSLLAAASAFRLGYDASKGTLADSGFRVVLEILPRDLVNSGQQATQDHKESGEPKAEEPSRESSSGRDAAGFISLFNGKDITGWKPKGDQAKSQWKVGTARIYPGRPGEFQVVPDGHDLVNTAKESVDLYTGAEFGDAAVELEFMIPNGSNTGLYLMGQYELQIYDAHGQTELKNNSMGAIFGVAPPRVDASKPSGQWQKLYVEYLAPRFDGNGKKTANARIVKATIDGQVIHENLEIAKETGASLVRGEMARGPLVLQGDHGACAFRNIRVRSLDGQWLTPASNSSPAASTPAMDSRVTRPPQDRPVPPPPAAAPMDAAKAKHCQAAWAKYLGVPAETTNSIGMEFVLIPPGSS